MPTTRMCTTTISKTAVTTKKRIQSLGTICLGYGHLTMHIVTILSSSTTQSSIRDTLVLTRPLKLMANSPTIFSKRLSMQTPWFPLETSFGATTKASHFSAICTMAH